MPSAVVTPGNLNTDFLVNLLATPPVGLNLNTTQFARETIGGAVRLAGIGAGSSVPAFITANSGMVFATLTAFDAWIAANPAPAVNTVAYASTEGLGFVYNGGASIAVRPGWAPLGQNADPRIFGAAANGATDDSVAFQACVNYFGCVSLPENKTIRVNATIVIPAALSMFSIMGGRGSKIKWTGDVVGTGLIFLDFNTNYAVTPLARCTLRDFHLEGSHGTTTSMGTGQPLAVRCTNHVEIEGVEVSYSRLFGITVREARFASVKNCHVHHTARDGINISDSDESIVTGNYVHETDDDSIAIHNHIYSWQRGHVIANNVISRAQGIACYGINNATITGNVIQFFFGRGISMHTDARDGVLIEGINPALAITITGNTLLDGLDRANLDSINSTCPYIDLTFDSAQNGSLTYVPGWRAQTPYGYYQNVKAAADNLANTPIAESGEIIIANNIMKRTLPRTGMFSAQGFGLFWLRNGAIDYNLAGSHNTWFFKIQGYTRNLVIADNICSGEDFFLYVNSSGGVVEPIRNAKVKGNIVSDIAIRAITAVAGSATLDIEFTGNTFDLDPYHIHPNRGASGGWLVEANGPDLLFRGGNFGMTFRDNDIKNTCEISDDTLASLVSGQYIGWEDNRLWGTPAATGFSTSNKGVGDLPIMVETAFVHIECDPASADFGKVYRPYPPHSEALPASGTWLQGEFVKKRAFAITSSPTNPFRYVIIGWDRITTGTGNVLGVDWLERRYFTELVSAGAGYGGTVTQITSKATAVTLNAYDGQILMAGDALGAGASVDFEVNDSVITSGQFMVDAHIASSSLQYTVLVISVSVGRFGLRLTNITGGSLSQTPSINFRVKPISAT